MNPPAPPRWRSLLYVPAHKPEMVAGAHKRGADAVILDLEDSVPPEAKAEARAALQEAIPSVTAGGADALVRINKPWSLAWRDVEAAVTAGAHALLLPKVEDACQATVIASHLDDPNATPTRLIALVESARGLSNVQAIAAASPRLCGLIPGNEDLAYDLGVRCEPEYMLQIHQPILMAARAQGLSVYGTLGGSANFRDLAAFQRRVEFSKSWGFTGATCIHPRQIPIIHAVYTPNPDEQRDAQRIVEAFEEGGGHAIALDGRMIDQPIYLRAKRMLEREGEA